MPDICYARPDQEKMSDSRGSGDALHKFCSQDGMRDVLYIHAGVWRAVFGTSINRDVLYLCGGGEIRTLEGLSTLPPFQGGALDHYATPPIRAKLPPVRALYQETRGAAIWPPLGWSRYWTSRRALGRGGGVRFRLREPVGAERGTWPPTKVLLCAGGSTAASLSKRRCSHQSRSVNGRAWTSCMSCLPISRLSRTVARRPFSDKTRYHHALGGGEEPFDAFIGRRVSRKQALDPRKSALLGLAERLINEEVRGRVTRMVQGYVGRAYLPEC